MKTTLDIQDSLMLRAKRLAKRQGRPLRMLVEEGLRRVLAEEGATVKYELPDLSVGEPGGKNPLDARIAALCIAHGVEASDTRSRFLAVSGAHHAQSV